MDRALRMSIQIDCIIGEGLRCYAQKKEKILTLVIKSFALNNCILAMLDVFGKLKAIKNILLLYTIKTLLLNKRCHVSFF